MTTLLLVLSLARAAYAVGPAPASAAPANTITLADAPTPAPLPVRCERHLGEDFVGAVLRMKTLRTLPSHDKTGAPTAALRAVLDNHLENVFPDDVMALNSTPLPEFHVKAEEKLAGENSTHALMVLKIPGGQPAALIHRETRGDRADFLTMPLGEPAMREIREGLLEAYQLRDPLSPQLDQLRLMALFAEDRLRVDPARSNGLSSTDYADVLDVEVETPRDADEWKLTVRRDSAGTTLVRWSVDGEDHLEVFEVDQRAAALATAFDRLHEHLTEHPENLNFYVGEDSEREMWFGKVLLERNVIGHALRLPDDDLSGEILADVFGAYVNAGVFERHADKTGAYVLIKVDVARQIKILTERLRRRLDF